MYKNRLTYFLGFMLLFSLAVLGMIVSKMSCGRNFSFINREVACEQKPVIRKSGYAEIQAELEGYIHQVNSRGVTNASVYFRDLESGPIFGINEYADFAPASLLKLPLALVYFVVAESQPDLLSRKLIYNAQKSEPEQAFAASEHLVPETPYSIEELLRAMIINSDNQAYTMLYEYMDMYGPKDIIKNTYLEFGILAPEDGSDKIISVRRYASLFRALYNGSIINIRDSEKLLSWLSMSTFTSGLAAGVPSEVKVSHKFGERAYSESEKQLHDCGIIYYPENPYLLCIMTEGRDYAVLLEVIKQISGTIYREVDSRKL
jgi:beta-lactamase class A